MLVEVVWSIRYEGTEDGWRQRAAQRALGFVPSKFHQWQSQVTLIRFTASMYCLHPMEKPRFKINHPLFVQDRPEVTNFRRRLNLWRLTRPQGARPGNAILCIPYTLDSEDLNDETVLQRD